MNHVSNSWWMICSPSSWIWLFKIIPTLPLPYHQGNNRLLGCIGLLAVKRSPPPVSMVVSIVPLIGGRWYINHPIGSIYDLYTTYILPIGGLYATGIPPIKGNHRNSYCLLEHRTVENPPGHGATSWRGPRWPPCSGSQLGESIECTVATRWGVGGGYKVNSCFWFS